MKKYLVSFLILISTALFASYSRQIGSTVRIDRWMNVSSLPYEVNFDLNRPIRKLFINIDRARGDQNGIIVFADGKRFGPFVVPYREFRSIDPTYEIDLSESYYDSISFMGWGEDSAHVNWIKVDYADGNYSHDYDRPNSHADVREKYNSRNQEISVFDWISGTYSFQVNSCGTLTSIRLNTNITYNPYIEIYVGGRVFPVNNISTSRNGDIIVSLPRGVRVRKGQNIEIVIKGGSIYLNEIVLTLSSESSCYNRGFRRRGY